MDDNPTRCQEHPLKTVGGLVFTRIAIYPETNIYKWGIPL